MDGTASSRRHDSQFPTKQRVSVSHDSCLYALEIIANGSALLVSFLAFGSQLSGIVAATAGVGALSIATICNFSRGHVKLRRVELVIQVVQFAVALLAIGLLLRGGPRSSYKIALTLVSILSISILFTAIDMYHKCARRTMRERLSRWKNRECKEIVLPSPSGRKATTALYVRNRLTNFAGVAKLHESFSLETFNTALMRPLISEHCGKMRSPMKRAEQIAESLQKMRNDLPTHFWLQECFSEEATTIIVAALSGPGMYPLVICDTAPFPGKVGEGSGLVFASFWQPEQLLFESCYCYGSEESVTNKGVLIAKFKENITVCNVHLVSRASMEKRKQRLQQQVAPIVEKIEGSIVIAGDFNLPPRGQHQVSLPTITFLPSPISHATFFNIAHPKWKKNTCAEVDAHGSDAFLRDQRGEEAIFDHIGVTADISSKGAYVHYMYDRGREPTPSDHDAIRATLTRN